MASVPFSNLNSLRTEIGDGVDERPMTAAGRVAISNRAPLSQNFDKVAFKFFAV